MNEALNEMPLFAGLPAGEPHAPAEAELRRLMGAYHASLLRFTGSILRDIDLALDCVQDTFFRAYLSLDRGKQVNKRWLFTVAHNRAIDELRRRHSVPFEPERFSIAASDGPGETSMWVRQAMNQLNPQHHEVLYLFGVAGFKTDEIARMLGTTGPAVRQRLYRARKEFRRAFGETRYG